MQALNDSDIKKELVELLKLTINFLDVNNIKYSIAYGTLLGAVRHKGFIPWDDDIDLIMTRKEYTKLIEILKLDNNIKDGIEATGFELGTNYYPFLKIVNKNIRTKELVTKHIYEDGFLWIDIFPIDNFPELFSSVFSYIIDEKMRFIYDQKRLQIQFPELAVGGIYGALIKRIDFNRYIKFYINICKMFENNKCKYIKDIAWNHFKKLPCSILDETITYQFEDITVIGLKNYDWFLTNTYGDYMVLPPVDKRVNHGLKAWYVE